MGFTGQVKRTDAFDHLGGQPVCGGALQAIFHTGVTERFDVHVGEGRSAAGNAHGDAHMRAVDALDQTDRRE